MKWRFFAWECGSQSLRIWIYHKIAFYSHATLNYLIIQARGVRFVSEQTCKHEVILWQFCIPIHLAERYEFFQKFSHFSVLSCPPETFFIFSCPKETFYISCPKETIWCFSCPLWDILVFFMSTMRHVDVFHATRGIFRFFMAKWANFQFFMAKRDILQLFMSHARFCNS